MPKDSAMYDTLAGGDADSTDDGDDMGDTMPAPEPESDPELTMHAKTIFGEQFTPEKQAALKEFVAACMAAPDEYQDADMEDIGTEVPA